MSIVLSIPASIHKQKALLNEGGIVKDLICYCFEYSVDDIHQDYMENGKSTITEKIQRENDV